MDTSTKVLIGLGVAAVGAIAVASYIHNEKLSDAAQAAEEELARRKEERFLLSIVKNYRLDHALHYGNRKNINYTLLDTIIDRELKMMLLVDRNTHYQGPTIKAQAESAQLVGRFGVKTDLTPLQLAKSVK